MITSETISADIRPPAETVTVKELMRSIGISVAPPAFRHKMTGEPAVIFW